MASPDQLQEAIKSATLERLRVTLLAICAESKEASDVVSRVLLVKDSPSKKRKRANEPGDEIRYEVCTQCKEEFDTTINDSESCQWHDGELELDMEGDYWADHDEPISVLDSKENRRDNPDGFIWSCCDTLGAGGNSFKYRSLYEKDDEDGEKLDGCKIGRHRSARYKAQRLSERQAQGLSNVYLSTTSESSSSEFSSSVDDDEDEDDEDDD